VTARRERTAREAQRAYEAELERRYHQARLEALAAVIALAVDAEELKAEVREGLGDFYRSDDSHVFKNAYEAALMRRAGFPDFESWREIAELERLSRAT
jgi:Tfp pilus assembly protein PilN